VDIVPVRDAREWPVIAHCVHTYDARRIGDLGVAVRFVSGTRMVTRSKPGARAASSLVSGRSGPSAVNRGTIFRRGTHRKAIRLLYFALESRLFECLRCLQSPGFRGFHGWS
jgi:hypothetical protein